MRQNTLDTIYTLLAAAKTPQHDIQVKIRELLPLLAQLDPNNYQKHYNQLVTLMQRIEHVAGRDNLQQKTVIGVGGSFSAGKSRFINSLLGIDILPEALEPCTAVATYLSWDKQECTQALNLFNHHIEIKSEHLGQLRHFVDDKNSQSESIQLGQLLQHVHIGNPAVRWKHIAFLDTPGYSKADGQHHAWSDYQTALMQLSEADYVIWLVSAKNGTICNEDLEFLQAIELRKSLFVVVTQSDLVLQKEIEPIMQGIKKHLTSKNIPLAGMMAWAAPIAEVSGKYIAGDDILNWLDKANKLMMNNYQEELHLLCNIAIIAGIHQVEKIEKNLQSLTIIKSKHQKKGINIQQLDEVLGALDNSQNIKYQSMQSLVNNIAALAGYIFNDNQQVAKYHYILQIELKKFTDRLKRSNLQYQYALFEVEQENYQSAIEYMLLAAKQNHNLAYNWLKNKATQGDIDAQLKMIELFDSENLHEEDIQVVFNYCYSALRNNNQIVFHYVVGWAKERKIAIAQYLLATSYFFGYAVSINYIQAYNFYTLASLELLDALYNKTVMDYLGQGEKKPDTKSKAIAIFGSYSDPKFTTAFRLLSGSILIKKPCVLDYYAETVNFTINYKLITLLSMITIFTILLMVISVWGMVFGIVAIFIYISIYLVRKNNIKEAVKKQEKNELESGKGVWTDPNTGLMWARICIGQQWLDGKCIGDGKRMSLRSAMESCQNFQLADYNNWRLPTIEELKKVNIKHNKNDIFFNPNSTFASYWASNDVDNGWNCVRPVRHESIIYALEKLISNYVLYSISLIFKIFLGLIVGGGLCLIFYPIVVNIGDIVNSLRGFIVILFPVIYIIVNFLRKEIEKFLGDKIIGFYLGVILAIAMTLVLIYIN